MKQPTKPTERLKLLIEPKFQLAILLYGNLLLLLMLSLSIYPVIYLFAKLDPHTLFTQLPTPEIYSQLLEQQKKSLMALMIVSGGLTLFLGNVAILILTHRIVGPIVKTRHLLQSLIKGEIKESIQFRKTDFFKDLEIEWNQYLKKTNKR